jgi:hypothetical protein
MFRTYKRKIELFVYREGVWQYAFSTVAFKTLKAAKAHAEQINPNTAFKAAFSE